MHGLVIEDLVTLKNITAINRFNGLTLVLFSLKGWYTYDESSIETPDDFYIIQPTDGIGRWYRDSNDTNIYNNFNNIVGSGALVIDVDLSDNHFISINGNATLSFTGTRNTRLGISITRSSTFNITSWSGVTWPSSAFSFTSGKNRVILDMIKIGSSIYNVGFNEYA